MNKVFAEHVTNTAFFLSISKRQVEMLMHLYNTTWQDSPNSRYYKAMWELPMPHNFIAITGALTRKGLCVRVIHDKARNLGHEELTEAGRLACLLLIEAGLGIDMRETSEAANA